MKNTKTIFVDFEYISKGNVQKNQAIISIEPKTDSKEAVIKRIGFKHPVSFFHYEQLLELSNKAIEILSQENENQETALTIEKNIPGIVKTEKGIGNFRNMVEGMATKLKKNGKLSPEESKNVDTAFSLIDKFLGIKK